MLGVMIKTLSVNSILVTAVKIWKSNTQPDPPTPKISDIWHSLRIVLARLHDQKHTLQPAVFSQNQEAPTIRTVIKKTATKVKMSQSDLHHNAMLTCEAMRMNAQKHKCKQNILKLTKLKRMWMRKNLVHSNWTLHQITTWECLLLPRSGSTAH